MTNTPKTWQEKSRETVFEKYGRRMEKVVFQMPDGKESDYYIKGEQDTAAVVALTKDNKVILLEQFRPGPKKVLSELPGGFVDKGEDPTTAAERELTEETGYSGKCQLILKFHDCAYSTRTRYCFLATDCEKVAEPQEQEINMKLVSLDKFRDKAFNGEMTDTACALAALAKLA